jgi:hypothetical protein
MPGDTAMKTEHVKKLQDLWRHNLCDQARRWYYNAPSAAVRILMPPRRQLTFTS